jgi:hypothetical protein
VVIKYLGEVPSKKRQGKTYRNFNVRIKRTGAGLSKFGNEVIPSSVGQEQGF